MKLLNEARKTLVALTAACGVAVTALSDGKGISGPESFAILIAFLSALGVYGVANKSPQVAEETPQV